MYVSGLILIFGSLWFTGVVFGSISLAVVVCVGLLLLLYRMGLLTGIQQ
jgi:hypothetical protein